MRCEDQLRTAFEVRGGKEATLLTKASRWGLFWFTKAAVITRFITTNVATRSKKEDDNATLSIWSACATEATE